IGGAGIAVTRPLDRPPQDSDARQVRSPEAELHHLDAAGKRIVALRACQAFGHAFSHALENSDNGAPIAGCTRPEICSFERTHAVGLPWCARVRDARCRWLHREDGPSNWLRLVGKLQDAI